MRDGRQKMEVGRPQPVKCLGRYYPVWLAILLLLSVTEYTAAQDKSKENSFITFRQRLLNQKRDEGTVEKVDSFSKLHLMICGNVYQTEKHAAYAYDKTTGKYDYRSQFKYIQPLLNLGDITLVNLKTFFSNDVKNMFSSPDEFGLALKYAGVNAVMHANVHTANIDKAILKRTDEVLDEY
ncbi:MAG TPA: CapA family protein, partial [Chitinophagales bacterium]|nr:CapA family protein [Chitinophagales bacterium]